MVDIFVVFCLLFMLLVIYKIGYFDGRLDKDDDFLDDEEQDE